MPIACWKALRETAVVRTACAPPMVRCAAAAATGGRAVPRAFAAGPPARRYLAIFYVVARHVQPHGGSILTGVVPEPADSGNDDPLAWLCIGFLQALVRGHTGAQDGR